MKMNSAMAVIVVLAMVMMAVTGTGALRVYVCDIDTDMLKPCMSAVRKPTVDPEAACCSLMRLPSTNVTCLCYFANAHPYILRFMGIYPDLAKALPSKCNLAPPHECVLSS